MCYSYDTRKKSKELILTEQNQHEEQYFFNINPNYFYIVQFNSSHLRRQNIRILHHTLRMKQHFISASEQVLSFKSFMHPPTYIQLIRYIRGNVSIYCIRFWLQIKAAQNMTIFWQFFHLMGDRNQRTQDFHKGCWIRLCLLKQQNAKGLTIWKALLVK